MEQSDIEIFFRRLKELLLEYNSESSDNFKGLTIDEINSLEVKFNIKFPETYSYFLKYMACGSLRIFDCQKYDIDGIMSAQIVSEEILTLDKKELPTGSFAFSQWQGYQFFYFVNTGDANPPTFQYIEGDDPSYRIPPNMNDTFLDWLVTLTIQSLALNEKLYKWDTKKGIELARMLYSRNSLRNV